MHFFILTSTCDAQCTHMANNETALLISIVNAVIWQPKQSPAVSFFCSLSFANTCFCGRSLMIKCTPMRCLQTSNHLPIYQGGGGGYGAWADIRFAWGDPSAHAPCLQRRHRITVTSEPHVQIYSVCLLTVSIACLPCETGSRDHKNHYSMLQRDKWTTAQFIRAAKKINKINKLKQRKKCA